MIWLATSLLSLILLMTAFVIAGRINGDEGWYLWASTRAVAGELPYRDFAFTQTPLSPYIFGPFQWLWPGIYGGRAFSVLILAGCVSIGIRLLRKRGMAAQALYVTLVLFNWKFLYYLSIPKLYGLVTLCFLSTLFALRTRRFTLAIILACAACLIRISAVPFLLPIVLYVLWFGHTRQRVLAIAIPFFFAAALYALAATNMEAASWGLWGHHIGQWGDSGLAGRLATVLNDRLPELLKLYSPWILVFAVTLRRLSFTALDGPMAIVVLSTAAFAFTHLISGGWYAEYQVPALMVFTFASAELLAQWMESVPLKKCMAVGLVTVLLLGMTWLYLPGIRLERTGGRLPVEEGRSLGHDIINRKSPSGRIFVLELLWIAVDVGLPVSPALGMGQFSPTTLQGNVAKHLHLLDAKLTREILKDPLTEVVLLTDHDWTLLDEYPRIKQTLNDLLLERFTLEEEIENFGQYNGTVHIYWRSSQPLLSDTPPG